MRLTDFHSAIILLIGLVQLWGINADGECIQRQMEYGIVCVCNSTYCDFVGSVNVPDQGSALHYWSDQTGNRLQKTIETFGDDVSDDAVTVTVDRSTTYQTMMGFGGAITDSTGINIAKLSEAAQDMLLQNYFSPDGIGYTFVRVPMAGCDMSTRTYTYDDVEDDVTLEHFNLTYEDYDYKIPYMKKAQEMSPHPLLFFTAPWSSPKWTKTNDDLCGQGSLKPEYYDYWAQYHIKFLQAYADAGINFWAISTGNEPNNGNNENFYFNCLGWTPETERDWLVNNFGPLIKSNFPDMKILIFDDQRIFIPDWVDVVLSNETAYNYADGVAVHWYRDTDSSPEILSTQHEAYPEKFILYTEACIGLTEEIPVKIGEWERAERYASDMIDVINQWTVGWVEWNLAMAPDGGPTWVGNYLDAPIIVNETSNEFYKEPMFYALGHFSKFVPQGSIRIALDVETLYGTAFIRPDGALAVVLLNKETEDVTANLVDADRGKIQVVIPAKSLHTFIWN